MTNDTVSSDLPLNPTNLGGPAVTWSITPELSSGLMFDALTGIISGTPDSDEDNEGMPIIENLEMITPIQHVCLEQNIGMDVVRHIY